MNKQNLAIPFSLKDEVKKSHPIKFDGGLKTWYIEYPDKLPDDLVKYIETYVDVQYEEREEYKAKFKSLQWDGQAKSWKCSREDAEKIEAYKALNI